jgi:hypothetical protein
MTTGPRPAKHPLIARHSFTVWLEGLIALCLIGLGGGGTVLAMQFRPYLGDPLTDPTQVPVRVIESPNIPVLVLFVLALGVGLTGLSWFGARVIHWRFFSPVNPWRVWQQAILVGVLAVVLAWLKINQALTLPLAVVVILALSLIGVYLSLRGTQKGDV